jgi:isopentenyl diphosphate isomerase/L-lactate dehydrogenase-like FMN-dependent dehydrogenase
MVLKVGSKGHRSRHSFDTFEEARRLAQRRLPPSLFADMMGGAGRGVTARRNVEVFDEVSFRPRAAVAWPKRDLRTTVLGTEISLPVILAPVGALRLANPGGAPAAARAAEAAGTICAVSMAAGHLPTDVARAASGPVWQQLYLFQGREVAERIIGDAKREKFGAIIVTVDTPASLKPPIQLSVSVSSALEYGPELIRRPQWLAGFLKDGMQLAAARAALGPMIGGVPVWDDLEWIKELWGGPIVVKGIVTADDARRAVDRGASAVVVSNHGGLILDSAPPTLTVLSEVVAAIGDQTEVLFDGGVRQGADVIKAIAVGARAVLIGRSYLAGLAVGGESGVRRVLENYRREIDATLAMIGCPKIEALDPSYVQLPEQWTTSAARG